MASMTNSYHIDLLFFVGYIPLLECFSGLRMATQYAIPI
jgi:hypothetical protein